MKLSDIGELKVAVNTERSFKIKLLHRLIFDNDAGRQNRKNLRNFTGFNFKVDDDEYQKKIDKVKNDFSLNELITICNVLCISNDDTFDNLVIRVISYLCDLSVLENNIIRDESDSEEELIDDDVNSDDNSERSLNESVIHNSCDDLKNDSYNRTKQLSIPEYCKPILHFTDIETMIVPFEGNSCQNIQTWIDNFEEIMNLVNLNAMHKLVIARKSLTGKAKLFVQSESKITSWERLKELLLAEFGSACNSADLHELLSKRKMRDSESVDEYFLKMKEICKNGNIDEAALMRYVIKGIPDKQENKNILYGCRNLSEFKEKLKIYEIIKNDSLKSRNAFDKTKSKQDVNVRFNSFDSKQKYESSDRFNSKNGSANKNRERYYDDKSSSLQNRYNSSENRNKNVCFNCGERNHISKFCVHKDKGIKCFRCDMFGHRASECPKANSKPEIETLNVNLEPKPNKIAIIGGFKIDSLVDTGSQLTLVKKSVFDKLGIGKLLPLNSTLSGLGRSRVRSLGYFNDSIQIDDFECNADICVVENNVMTYDAIIGLNVLMQGETIINENGITIKSKSQCVEEVNTLTVLPINVCSNDVEINIDEDVPSVFRDKVQELVSSYAPRKTKTTNVELNILVKNNEPVSHQPRRLPFSEKKIVEGQVAEWLEQGIVEPCSSEYCSPVVVVRKKDGSPRVCIDYRKLNKVVVKDRFPLPLIEDILDRLQAANIFSTIDLKNGFFHVDVNKESRKYTSFVTHEGQYQFLKVPFGLCNSPAVFQRYINTIFRPLINDGIVLPYMDDVIILSSSFEEGIERLEKVLRLASEYGLEINFKKSHFLKKRIEFLGHIIEEGKIYPSTLKTKAVLHFPEPSNLKQVHSFLGLTGYFRKFIPKYSVIARPLSDLLKKDRKFIFGDAERNAFNHLKSLLAEKPVLAIYHPNYEKENVLKTGHRKCKEEITLTEKIIEEAVQEAVRNVCSRYENELSQLQGANRQLQEANQRLELELQELKNRDRDKDRDRSRDGKSRARSPERTREEHGRRRCRKYTDRRDYDILDVNSREKARERNHHDDDDEHSSSSRHKRKRSKLGKHESSTPVIEENETTHSEFESIENINCSPKNYKSKKK